MGDESSRKIALLAAVWAACAWGQTTVDLRTQSKDVDFSTATSTRPFVTGSTLPGTCAVGDLFYATGAAAGANVYGCTSTNVWTLESGGGGGSGATSASQLTDFQAVRNTSTNLLIGSSCHAGTPCNARLGGVAYSFTAPASVNVSSGTGTLYVYISNSGALTLGNNIGAVCASGCVAAGGITAFPADALPLYTWTVTNGTLDLTGGTDFRAFLSTKDVNAGTGLTSTLSGGTSILSVDTTVIPSFAGANVFTGSDDFTNASSTAPNKTGTVSNLPSTCTVGQTYFETNAAAGQNLFGCTATNTWTQLSGGGGGGGGTISAISHYFPVGGGTNGGGTSNLWAWNFNAGGPGCTMADTGAFPPTAGTPADCQQSWYEGGANTDLASFSDVVPAGWTSGTVTFAIRYQGGGFGNAIQFKVAAVCLANNTPIPPTYNSVQTLPSVTTSGTNFYITSLSGLTMTGCAAGNTLNVVIARADTSGYAHVYGASLAYAIP
jgi:hypothetical protein